MQHPLACSVGTCTFQDDDVVFPYLLLLHNLEDMPARIAQCVWFIMLTPLSLRVEAKLESQIQGGNWA